ncbi:hypothetical protein [Francisella philomiragia]|uniref:hypothetical protein n=1 Tax=Francisella philomiragia TaxID=28110 RepID=UPI001C9DD212|nr:hypothetical protein [Francisella philomiragia]MBY7733736.1 hypothetical protein [Francisella philomiragia]
MQRLEIKKSQKYRVIVYSCLIFLTSFVIGTYHNQNIIFYLGVFLISLSIFFESQLNRQIIEAIVLPNESDDESLIFIINSKESDFWDIRQHIIINTWIYVYAVQQGSNKKIKIWLHKSNFKNKNDIRNLAKYISFIRDIKK